MKLDQMAGHLIRRLHQTSTQVFARCMQEAGLDMTAVQFAAMEAIIAEPGIDQAGVAARIAYDRATIGGVIDRLEQKGYVERTVSTRDRRSREVRPTETGRKIHQKIVPIVVKLQGDILKDLDHTERAAFLALARKAIGQRDA